MKEVKDLGIREGRFKAPTFVSVLIAYSTIPVEFLHSFARLQPVPNSANQLVSYKNCEIGVARCKAVEEILGMPERPKYILWMSGDDLPPWDGLVRLWMEMETGKWDVLTSLVHLKNEPPTPVLWKLPDNVPLQVYKDFQPGDVVGGVGYIGNLGFALMSPSIFEKMKAPYFKTGFMTEILEDGREALTMYTEDCVFFEQCAKLDMKVGIHTGVRSAHLGKNGEVY